MGSGDFALDLFGHVQQEHKWQWVQMEHNKIHLNILKSFFTVRATEHRNRLPREVVASPSVKILKIPLHSFLYNQLLVKNF